MVEGAKSLPAGWHSIGFIRVNVSTAPSGNLLDRVRHYSFQELALQLLPSKNCGSSFALTSLVSAGDRAADTMAAAKGDGKAL